MSYDQFIEQALRERFDRMYQEVKRESDAQIEKTPPDRRELIRNFNETTLAALRESLDETLRIWSRDRS